MKYLLLFLTIGVFFGCSKSDKLRQEVMVIAEGKIKDGLKAPGSARFPSLASDSVIIRGWAKGDTSFSGATLLYDDDIIKQGDGTEMNVILPYQAQNSFGVYLPGVYSIFFIKKAGQWVVNMDRPLPMIEFTFFYPDMLKDYKDKKKS